LANTTGSAITNVKGVNELKAIPLPLPILEEQKTIIMILEEYMSVISIFDKQVDNNLKRAKYLRQSILKKAFSGKLVCSAKDYELDTPVDLPLAAETATAYGTRK
jgi:type I restriction enzyme S subunit